MLVDAKLMINGKELKTQIEIDETDLESVQSKEKVDRGYGCKWHIHSIHMSTMLEV